ncbi:Alcohol acetyltransferase [Savitreella phatthalungensis]
MTSTASRRPAGNCERRCIARDIAGLYGTVAVLGLYVPPPDLNDEDEIKDSLIDALEVCIAKHPALRTCIINTRTKDPVLVTMSCVSEQDHVHWLEPITDTTSFSDAARDTLLHVHAQPFRAYEERPQWELYARAFASTRRYIFVFAYSHALLDGRSSVNFHTTFLQALRNPGQQPPDAAQGTPLNIEKSARLELSLGYLLKTLATEYLPKPLKRACGLAPPSSKVAYYGAPKRPPPPKAYQLVETAVSIALVDSETLSRAVAVCRQHDARLTGLLNHLSARVLAHSLHARGTQNCRAFLLDTAMDMRRAIPGGSGQLANFASTMYETYEIASPPPAPTDTLDESTWSAVRRTTDLLAERSSSTKDQVIGALKYIDNMHTFNRQRSVKPAEESFSVSNLGVFPGLSNQKDTWQVAELVFTQSGDAVGAPIELNFASAAGGSLSITATWVPGMLDVGDYDREQKFMDEVCEGIAKAVIAISLS